LAWGLADLATKAARDEFGSEIVYTPVAGGGPFTLTATFDRAFEAVSLGGADFEIASRRPILDLRLADLSVEPKTGDSLTVDGSNAYTVEEIEPDGRGSAKLFLHGPAA
jgi:hypothetical protein